MGRFEYTGREGGDDSIVGWWGVFKLKQKSANISVMRGFTEKMFIIRHKDRTILENFYFIDILLGLLVSPKEFPQYSYQYNTLEYSCWLMNSYHFLTAASCTSYVTLLMPVPVVLNKWQGLWQVASSCQQQLVPFSKFKTFTSKSMFFSLNSHESACFEKGMIIPLFYLKYMYLIFLPCVLKLAKTYSPCSF